MLASVYNATNDSGFYNTRLSTMPASTPDKKIDYDQEMAHWQTICDANFKGINADNWEEFLANNLPGITSEIFYRMVLNWTDVYREVQRQGQLSIFNQVDLFGTPFPTSSLYLRAQLALRKKMHQDSTLNYEEQQRLNIFKLRDEFDKADYNNKLFFLTPALVKAYKKKSDLQEIDTSNNELNAPSLEPSLTDEHIEIFADVSPTDNELKKPLINKNSKVSDVPQNQNKTDAEEKPQVYKVYDLETVRKKTEVDEIARTRNKIDKIFLGIIITLTLAVIISVPLLIAFPPAGFASVGLLGFGGALAATMGIPLFATVSTFFTALVTFCVSSAVAYTISLPLTSLSRAIGKLFKKDDALRSLLPEDAEKLTVKAEPKEPSTSGSSGNMSILFNIPKPEPLPILPKLSSPRGTPSAVPPTKEGYEQEKVPSNLTTEKEDLQQEEASSNLRLK